MNLVVIDSAYKSKLRVPGWLLYHEASVTNWFKELDSDLGTTSFAAGKTLIDSFLPMPIQSAIASKSWGVPGVISSEVLNGHMTHFTFAVLDIPKNEEKGNDTHGSKIIVVPFDGAALDRDLKKPRISRFFRLPFEWQKVFIGSKALALV